jgi:hypothetical protein
LLEGKDPVIVLKDVSIKYLLLILEYVYVGKVEIELEDVKDFKEVAKILQIKVEFEEERQVEEDMSQDLLTEIPDEEMNSSFDDHTMDNASSESDDMEFSAEPTRKITTGRKFEDEEAAHKKGPPAKKLKKSNSGLTSFPTKTQSSNPCIFCSRVMTDKNRKYHQRFCWENPDRIASECKYCDRKFQVPGKLRVHMNLRHPEIKH